MSLLQPYLIFQSAVVGIYNSHDDPGEPGLSLSAPPHGPSSLAAQAAAPNRSTGSNQAKKSNKSRRGPRNNQCQGLGEAELGQTVPLLVALTLQQEDALNRLRQDTSFTVHFQQQGQGAVLVWEPVPNVPGMAQKEDGGDPDRILARSHSEALLSGSKS